MSWLKDKKKSFLGAKILRSKPNSVNSSGKGRRRNTMLDVSWSALTLLTQVLTGIVLYNPVNSGASDGMYEELYCLSLNAYWEARGEGLDEKLAVSQVVMNRLESDDYPNMICDVITEGPIRESWTTRQNVDLAQEDRIYYPVKNKCQFSWYCDGRSDEVRNLHGWEDSVIAALLAYIEYGANRVDGATHYYAHEKISKPSWAENMTVTMVLEGHTYLR